eukprot:g2311.t1
MSWRHAVEADLAHAHYWKQALEVIEFLQGEWTNAEDSSENYFVMGTSVRRINSKGTKTFEKHLQWEAVR